MRNSRVLISIAAGCVGLFISGCSLNQPYPAKDTFVLRAGDAPRAAATLPEQVRVESVRIAPPFDSRSLVYRTGEVAFNRDYYNVFISDPETLATGELVRMLTESKAFAEVSGPSSLGSATVRLECMVTELYADERDPKNGVAVCSARYRLLRETPGITTIEGDWTFEARVPIASDSGSAVAQSLGVVFGMTAKSFIEVVATPGNAKRPIP